MCAHIVSPIRHVMRKRGSSSDYGMPVSTVTMDIERMLEDDVEGSIPSALMGFSELVVEFRPMRSSHRGLDRLAVPVCLGAKAAPSFRRLAQTTPGLSRSVKEPTRRGRDQCSLR
jgi:hypothetical protein